MAKRKPKKKVARKKVNKRVRKIRRNPKSITYGNLPSFEEYSKAFDKEVSNGKYKIRNDRRVGNVDLNKYELWRELFEATIEWDQGNEIAGDWASSVLSTLGFEWI